jgi:predicted nucleic acid-binding protein
LKSWLLDTGPLVAYLNGADPEHRAAVACLDGFAGRLCTTPAVVTEAMHFLGDNPAGPALMVEFLEAAQVEIYDCTQRSQLRSAVALMARYRTLPMDFADATLVLLADELGVTEILTLDRRGFSSFRTRRGRAFRLVLDAGGGGEEPKRRAR